MLKWMSITKQSFLFLCIKLVLEICAFSQAKKGIFERVDGTENFCYSFYTRFLYIYDIFSLFIFLYIIFVPLSRDREKEYINKEKKGVDKKWTEMDRTILKIRTHQGCLTRHARLVWAKILTFSQAKSHFFPKQTPFSKNCPISVHLKIFQKTLDFSHAKCYNFR